MRIGGAARELPDIRDFFARGGCSRENLAPDMPRSVRAVCLNSARRNDASRREADIAGSSSGLTVRPFCEVRSWGRRQQCRRNRSRARQDETATLLLSYPFAPPLVASPVPPRYGRMRQSSHLTIEHRKTSLIHNQPTLRNRGREVPSGPSFPRLDHQSTALLPEKQSFSDPGPLPNATSNSQRVIGCRTGPSAEGLTVSRWRGD